MERVRRAAPGCMLFLKRDGSFPLKAPGRLALYGNGARYTLKGGTGSGDVNSHVCLTAEEALEQAGFTVTSGAWLDAYDRIRARARAIFIQSVRMKALSKLTLPTIAGMGRVMPEPEYKALPLADADAAVYILSRSSGEGGDRKNARGDLQLTKTEVRDIHACMRRYPRFVLVLNTAGMVDLSEVMDVPNILLLSQLGTATGEALADVLLGRACPSGKLAATWCGAGTLPSVGGFGIKDDTVYQEGVYVGYRYWDAAGAAPLFPFGYGLSYTDFSVCPGDVTAQGSGLKVQVRVRNTGGYRGREVAQLYVSPPAGKHDQPYQKLIAFKKTPELAPGEEACETLEVRLSDLASYDVKKAAWIIGQGDYLLRLGNSSRDTAVCGIVRAPRDIIVRKVENIGGRSGFKDWVPPKRPRRAQEAPEGTPVIDIGPENFAQVRWPQPAVPDGRAMAFAMGLKDAQLANIVIGDHKAGPASASVIGSASTEVVGAAGNSTHRVPGLPSITMADGPAGLRLNLDYIIDKNGRQPVGSTLPPGMEDFLSPPVKLALSGKKPAKGQKVYHQYCTAIPTGTALAQSWDTETVRGLGTMVADEMRRFGVQLWLAPGMNIQRDPRCGRNFEYYSEDPYLTGMMAAAMTRGVQSLPGCGVTIKHFCCNNQETNRYNSNSRVSERALREIYLKGFEICLRESAPAALMTSYNLVNGVHTSQRRDLLLKWLRGEQGFSGVIMSDWVIPGMGAPVNKYPNEQAVWDVKGGGCLAMPGSSRGESEVLSALKGRARGVHISREEIQDRAAWVIQTAWALCGRPEGER